MGTGVYSGKIRPSALAGDDIDQAAEVNRLVLLAAVQRHIKCQATGVVLDLRTAVLSTVKGLGGEAGRDVSTLVTASHFDETNGYEMVPAVAAQYGATDWEIIDGRNYRADGNLTADARRRMEAAAEAASVTVP